MPSTVNKLLPYPALTATPNVPADIQGLAVAVDTKYPGGWIGYAQAVANQATITAEVDLTSLSVAVTVGTTRRIRVSVNVYVNGTAGGDTAVVKIKEGVTSLTERGVAFVNTNEFAGLDASVILTPSAGPHTYKATLQRSAGVGSVTSNAAATYPAFILVEDIGPVTL